MIKRFVSFFGSLRLTLVCLCLAILLVFAGTLAQVQSASTPRRRSSSAASSFFGRCRATVEHPGLSRRLDHRACCCWSISFALTFNDSISIAAKSACSSSTRGLILLLGGFSSTELFQHREQNAHRGGRIKELCRRQPRNELVVLDVTNPDRDKVVAIPQAALERGGEIRPAGLPFALRVKNYLPNSQPAGPMSGDAEKIKAGQRPGPAAAFCRRASGGTHGRRKQAGRAH